MDGYRRRDVVACCDVAGSIAIEVADDNAGQRQVPRSQVGQPFRRESEVASIDERGGLTGDRRYGKQVALPAGIHACREQMRWREGDGDLSLEPESAGQWPKAADRVLQDREAVAMSIRDSNVGHMITSKMAHRNRNRMTLDVDLA